MCTALVLWLRWVSIPSLRIPRATPSVGLLHWPSPWVARLRSPSREVISAPWQPTTAATFMALHEARLATVTSSAISPTRVDQRLRWITPILEPALPTMPHASSVPCMDQAKTATCMRTLTTLSTAASSAALCSAPVRVPTCTATHFGLSIRVFRADTSPITTLWYTASLLVRSMVTPTLSSMAATS